MGIVVDRSLLLCPLCSLVELAEADLGLGVSCPDGLDLGKDVPFRFHGRIWICSFPLILFIDSKYD